MSLVFISLDAVTLNGAGAVMQLDKPRKSFGLQYTVTGDPSGSIHLDASFDGINYFSVWSSALSLGTFGVMPSPILAAFLRARLADMTNSATTTAVIAVED